VGRSLGPDLFGLFFLGVSVLKIAEIVSTLGLHRGVLRFVALFQGMGDEARTKGTILFSLRATFAVSLVLAILIFILSPFAAAAIFHRSGLTTVLRLFALTVPFTAVGTILVFATQGFKIMKYRVWIRELFEPGSRTLLVIVIFALGWRFYGAVAAFITSIVLGTILASYLTHKAYPLLRKRSLKPVSESRKILHFSWPLLLADFFGLVVIWINILMIGYFEPAAEVGIYSAAHRTALLGEVVLISFNAIFSPITADLYYRKDLAKLAQLFKLVNKWIFSLSLPVCLLMAFFASDLIQLFGKEYRAGAGCLVLLGLAQLVNSALGSSGFLIMMSGKSKINLLNNAFTAFLNIGLNLVLIPAYGIVGAAIAFLASISVVNIIMLIEVYVLFKMHPFRRDLYKPVLAGGVAFLIMFGLTRLLAPAANSIVFPAAGSLIFLLVYAFLVYLFKIGDEDKIVFKRIIAKISSFT
jgi:O-antigen/teichoic acid export membrane protein